MQYHELFSFNYDYYIALFLKNSIIKKNGKIYGKKNLLSILSNSFVSAAVWTLLLTIFWIAVLNILLYYKILFLISSTKVFKTKKFSHKKNKTLNFSVFIVFFIHGISCEYFINFDLTFVVSGNYYNRIFCIIYCILNIKWKPEQ